MIHLNALWDAVAALDPVWAYLTLFGVAVLENIIPVLPGDTIMVFGGYLAGQNYLGFLPLFVGTTLGSTCGFMLMYYLGVTKGRALFKGESHSWFAKRHVYRAERWFTKYGDNVVLINRFLAGARAVIAIMAGIGKMPPKKAALFATISAIIWNIVLISLGTWLGSNWKLAVRILKEYNIIISIVMLVLILVWLSLRRFGTSRRADRAVGSHPPREE